MPRRALPRDMVLQICRSVKISGRAAIGWHSSCSLFVGLSIHETLMEAASISSTGLKFKAGRRARAQEYK